MASVLTTGLQTIQFDLKLRFLNFVIYCTKQIGNSENVHHTLKPFLREGSQTFSVLKNKRPENECNTKPHYQLFFFFSQ